MNTRIASQPRFQANELGGLLLFELKSLAFVFCCLMFSVIIAIIFSVVQMDVVTKLKNTELGDRVCYCINGICINGTLGDYKNWKPVIFVTNRSLVCTCWPFCMSSTFPAPLLSWSIVVHLQ